MRIDNAGFGFDPDMCVCVCVCGVGTDRNYSDPSAE